VSGYIAVALIGVACGAAAVVFYRDLTTVESTVPSIYTLCERCERGKQLKRTTGPCSQCNEPIEGRSAFRQVPENLRGELIDELESSKMIPRGGLDNLR